ncbi:MAG: metallophosphoesterase [Fibrobacteria bacterium]
MSIGKSYLALAAAIAASTLSIRNARAAAVEDTLVLSFTSVGDSRQDPVSFDPTTAPLYGQDSIWLQSTKPFSRMLVEMINQKSKMLFFNGDMIMGYGNAVLPPNTATIDGILSSELVAFYKQYAFWRGMVAHLPELGTYVFPVPGNHEVQWKAGGKKAQVVNENAWRANMGDLLLDSPRFQKIFGALPGNGAFGDNRNAADSLASNQSKLSYSFDFKGCHFAVVNTDPVGKDSHAPTNWLAADLADAKARGAVRFFVFGHKPAYTYYYGAVTPLPTAPSGLDVDVPARNAFWDVIEQYKAAYFCGHEHIYNLMQPKGAAWQIMVGSGGSPFEAKPTDATVSPYDRYYAWVKVDVYQSGRTVLRPYGFNDAFGPTLSGEAVELP